MAKSVVELGVKDSGFNARIKDAIRTFASLGNATNNAKGQLAKFADGIAKVAQSQELLNAALKGNPYGMMASAATMAFTKIIEMATEASDVDRRLAADAEMKAERQQAANEAIGRSTGELMAKYEMLRVQWKALSSEQERNEWIANNQSAFKSLNLAVTDVTSAENVFVNNTSKVVAALKARAEAEAYGELYKEQIKKNAMNKATGKYTVPTVDRNYRPSLREGELAGLNRADWEKTTRKVMGRDGKYHDYIENTGRLMQSGVDKINALRSMGQKTNEMADEMQANYWANKMTQAQANASALLNNNLFGPIPKGGKGGGKIVDIKALVAGQWDKAMLKGANAGVKATELSGPSEAFKAYAASIEQGSEKAENSLTRLIKAFDELNEAQGVSETHEVNKDVNAVAESAKAAASAISSIGQAFSSIEDPAARVAGLVAQAIATVAVAYAQALETDWTSKTSIWGFISAAAASTASMIATIASIHQATGYAEGGEVKGNSYSGDNIPIMANAGEVVLTKAMTRTLAANLQGNGMGNMNLRTKVKGTELLVWLDNSLAQSGRGELVTWGQ